MQKYGTINKVYAGQLFLLAPEKGLVKMDTYCEYIVKKKNGGKELALRALIVLGAVALFVVFMLLGGVVRSFSMITTLLAFGSLYGGYLLITNMNVEYEYIVTNGEMDIDKIIARRRRKRMLTVNARTFEKFGPFKEAEHANESYSNRVYVCTSPADPGCYYAVLNHQTMGRILLVFSPNDHVLENLKIYIPKQAGGNAIYGNRPAGD